MKKVFIVSAKKTAIGSFLEALKIEIFVFSWYDLKDMEETWNI